MMSSSAAAAVHVSRSLVCPSLCSADASSRGDTDAVPAAAAPAGATISETCPSCGHSEMQFCALQMRIIYAAEGAEEKDIGSRRTSSISEHAMGIGCAWQDTMCITAENMKTC
ncbi:uncharacterized protein T551_02167 [Pneumocystis jirovecii RU7]|uniref:Uncharacterized protein n=1 Tax=Pneumocystis jirovecii (strain RU7) TaxID=1408657 RepID=A0A0W4ZME7_PNEJ7|nr:uncharacterized protein T551_02167 [Pneumocystis jirovecii RU7]KTW29551.1 hypothetical protein T551_02167 [Pneumocystis jirovecii RU7]